MTTVAVLADPPLPGVVLPALTPSPLSESEAVDLYSAALADVCAAVEASSGSLIVNYRSLAEDEDAEADADDAEVPDDDAEAGVRSAVADALSAPDDTRFEVQVGSTPSARVGNTITHLLEREESRTAAVAWPTAPFLTRSHLDNAAMKLRSSEVVLGPTTDGRVYYAGFAEPIDFEGALATPTVETLVERANDAGLSVDFLPMLPSIETPTDLRTAVPEVRSRVQASRLVPERTAVAVDDLGLRVVEQDGEISLVRS